MTVKRAESRARYAEERREDSSQNSLFVQSILMTCTFTNLKKQMLGVRVLKSLSIPEHSLSYFGLMLRVRTRYFDDLVINAEKQKGRDPLTDKKARFGLARQL